MYRSPKADLMRAFRVLAPDKTDHATRRAMAQLLGLDWKPPADAPAAGQVSEAAGPATTLAVAPPGARQPATPDVPEPVIDPIPFHLIARPLTGRSAPDWLEQINPFPVAAVGTKVTPLPLEPLFRPEWTRGILTGALACVQPDGPIDISRIIERICRGEALRELLRLELSTLARGVQLLVDQSEAMQPYRRDQKWLIGQLERIAGKYALEVRNFIGCPSRGMGRGPRLEWKPYREWEAPRTGSTVVVVTDLGITAAPLRHPRVRLQEWVDFARYVRGLACPLVAVLPFARERVPSALHRVMTVIQWDRATTASRVRSIVGKGLR